MSNLLEIKKTINFLNKSGLQKKNITILHCTSQYPTKAKDVNLNAMVTLKDKFNLDIGLSDHTLGFEASICAVHQGAKFIEKHLTLDKKMKGPDHQASLEPEEFKNFVKSLRNTPYLAGSYQKKPTKQELVLAKLARKRVVAKKNILKNETLTKDNITTKRSNKGIDATKYFNLINKKS